MLILINRKTNRYVITLGEFAENPDNHDKADKRQ